MPPTPEVPARSISRDVLDLLQERLPLLVSQLTRRLNIDQVTVDSGTCDDVSINKITLGQATIEQLTLSNISASLNGSQAFMKNVRTVTELKFTLEWGVDLGWIGSWGDTSNLGSISIPFNVGNISVPSLANIQFSVPTATVTNVGANIQPITGLALGPAHLGKITVTDTDAPSGGFTLTGIGLGDATLNKLTVPQTDTGSATIASLSPERHVTLPAATVTGVSLPAVNVGSIQSGGFGFDANAARRTLEADLGILEIRLHVDPVIHMNIESMTIQDAAFAVALGKLEAKNISLPLRIEGVNVQKLGLSSVKVNKISL